MTSRISRSLATVALTAVAGLTPFTIATVAKSHDFKPAAAAITGRKAG